MDGAQGQPKYQADASNTGRFNPNRQANLTAKSADRLQHAQFAPSVGNGDRERVDDPQNRDEYRDRDLHPSYAEPLLGQIRDVLPHLAVGKYKDPSIA